jgi:hypothetical protein
MMKSSCQIPDNHLDNFDFLYKIYLITFAGAVLLSNTATLVVEHYIVVIAQAYPNDIATAGIVGFHPRRFPWLAAVGGGTTTARKRTRLEKKNTAAQTFICDDTDPILFESIHNF